MHSRRVWIEGEPEPRESVTAAARALRVCRQVLHTALVKGYLCAGKAVRYDGPATPQPAEALPPARGKHLLGPGVRLHRLGVYRG